MKTDDGMKYGVWLPMQAWDGLDYETVARIGDCAVRAEELGFDGLWTYDHLVKGSAMYSVGWLEPMVVLSYVAALTSTLDLGTSVLVLPVREPLLLSKQVATLENLSRGRVILGVGAGWNPAEFSSVGMQLKERGRRTDESMLLMQQLFDGGPVDFDGEFTRLDGISLDPAPRSRVPFWYGGGSKPGVGGAVQEIADAVLNRIARCDGWLSRGAAPVEMIASDWVRIQAELRRLGRDPADFTFAHCNYCHVVETDDRDEAIAEQMRYYRRIVGADATVEEVGETHFLGTVEDIRQQIARIKAIGCNYLILGTLDYLPEQLELWKRLLLTDAPG
jgi:probable F420-dependent oxidoreductase